MQISASSQRDADHAAIGAILNFDADSNTIGSWSPNKDDKNPWLQIDLGGRYTRVTDVATKGGNQKWVTKYKLQYSDDGLTFRYYRELGEWENKVRENSFNEWPFLYYRRIMRLDDFGQTSFSSSV